MSDDIGVILRDKLCVSCEICRAVCPSGAIRMTRHGGQYLPVIDGAKCTGCGICHEACPGRRTTVTDEETPSPPGVLPERSVRCVAAKSRDNNLLAGSTSGGLVTGMLLDLLGQGMYDSVSVLDNIGSSSGIPRIQLTSDPIRIVGAAKSKYVPASAYDLVENLRSGARTIIVATPCVLKGIRNFAEIRGLDLDEALFIGLFCDQVMSLKFIDYMLKMYGKPGESISDLAYRDKSSGGWPGDMKITFSSGRAIDIPRERRMELKPFFKLPCCVHCTDKLNQAADISVGDCYVRGFEDRTGKSCAIIRSEKGRRAFLACEKGFFCEDLGLADIFTSQKLPYPGTVDEEATASANAARSRELRKITLGDMPGFYRIRCSLVKEKISRMAFKHARNAFATIILASRLASDIVTAFSGRQEFNHQEGIGVLGSNFSNRGAQAMALTVMDSIRGGCGEAAITLLVADYPSEAEKWHDFKVDLAQWDTSTKMFILCPRVLRKAFSRFLPRRVDHIDEALLGTGELLDISGFSLSSKFDWQKSLQYVMNLMVARRLRARVTLLPQSFGPWDYPRPARLFLSGLMSLYLKYPVNIFPREEESRRYLERYVRGLRVVPDIVLTSRPPDIDVLLRDGACLELAALPDDSVGIVPSRKVYERMRGEDFFSLYDEALSSIKENGFATCLTWYAEEDREICRLLLERYEGTGIIDDYFDGLNSIQAEDLIRQCRFILSSRYHSIIHAYRNSVPAIVVGWADKYPSLLRLFGQEEYLLEPENGIRRGDVKILIERLAKDSYGESGRITAALEGVRGGGVAWPFIQ